MYREELYRIIGAGMEVLRELGYGYDAEPYRNALALEFIEVGIPFKQNTAYDISFKGHKVGQYVAGNIVADAIIVDTLVVEGITDHERGHMLNNLRISDLPVGLIMNFARHKLEWERVML